MKTKIFTILFLLITMCFSVYPQWTQLKTSNGLPSNSLKINWLGAINGRIIFSFGAFNEANGIYLTTDNGDNWRTPNGNSLTNPLFDGYAVLNGKIFFGTDNNGVGVYYSSDNGENWDSLSNGLSQGSLGILGTRMLGEINGRLYLASSGLFYSDDEGSTWTKSTNGVPVNPKIWALAKLNSNYFFSVKHNYKSSDGINWTITGDNGLPFVDIRHLVASGSNLVADASGDGIYYSSDNGESWTKATGLTTADEKAVRDMVVNNNSIIVSAGTSFYISSDNGITWSNLDNSFPKPSNVRNFVINGSTAFAGTFDFQSSTGVWKKTISTTGIEISNTSIIPENFSISQNYPNPFNPSTNIQFSIPISSFVSLKVFDVLGKEVAALVNKELNTGTYNYNFDAGNLTSGIYFYRLETDSFVETKKMILLR